MYVSLCIGHIQVVREKYESYKEGIEILSLDEDELAKAIPQGSALQESNAVIQLRKLMEDVSKKKSQGQLIFCILITVKYFFFLC